MPLPRRRRSAESSEGSARNSREPASGHPQTRSFLRSRDSEPSHVTWEPSSVQCRSRPFGLKGKHEQHEVPVVVAIRGTYTLRHVLCTTTQRTSTSYFRKAVECRRTKCRVFRTRQICRTAFLLLLSSAPADDHGNYGVPYLTYSTPNRPEQKLLCTSEQWHPEHSPSHSHDNTLLKQYVCRYEYVPKEFMILRSHHNKLSVQRSILPTSHQPTRKATIHIMPCLHYTPTPNTHHPTLTTQHQALKPPTKSSRGTSPPPPPIL